MHALYHQSKHGLIALLALCLLFIVFGKAETVAAQGTTPIDLNTVVNGNIAVAGEEDTYTFQGTAGTRLRFDDQGGSFNLRVEFYSPGGNLLDNDLGFYDRYVNIPTTGTYSLVVYMNTTGTSTYTFQLWTETIDENGAITIDNLTATNGNLSQPGEYDRFTFSGSAGERLRFDDQGGSFNLRVEFYSPGGNLLSNDLTFYDRYLSTPTTGTYSMLVYMNDATETGSYTFQLWFETTDENGAITIDNVTATNGDLSQPGEYDRFTFNGTAGERLRFDDQGGSFNLRVEFYSPNNDLLSNDLGFYDRYLSTPTTGTYSVIVYMNNATETGSYTFQLWAETIDDGGQIIPDNVQAVVGSNSIPGQYDTYYFYAQAGNQLVFDDQNSLFDHDWALSNKNGEIFNTTMSDRSLTVPSTDCYRLWIYLDDPTATGSYTFQITTNNVINSPPSCPLPNAIPVINNPGPQTTIQGNPVSLPISASDSDGDTLTFNAVGLPPGLSINSSTGFISGTVASNAAANSPYNVTVTVSDGQDSAEAVFTWEVTTLFPMVTYLYPQADEILTGAANYEWPGFSFAEISGAQWYQIWVGLDNYSYTALFQWFEASQICIAGTCTIPTDIWLSNGNYEWWMNYWGPNYPTANYWQNIDFSVSFAAPSGAFNLTNPANGATINTAPATIEWARDTNVLWYQVWVGTDDYVNTIAFNWYDATQICDDTTCSLNVGGASFSDGGYEVWAEQWGPNGYVMWPASPSATFTLDTSMSVPAPAATRQ